MMSFDDGSLDTDVCTAVVRCMVDGHQGLRECALGKSSWRMLHDIIQDGFGVPDFIPLRVHVLVASEGTWHTCSYGRDLDAILAKCPLSVDILVQPAKDFTDSDAVHWKEEEPPRSSDAGAQVSCFDLAKDEEEQVPEDMDVWMMIMRGMMTDKVLAESVEKAVSAVLEMDEDCPLRQSLSNMASEMAARDAMDITRDVMKFVTDTRAEEETAVLERQRLIRESEEAEAAEFERHKAEMRQKASDEKPQDRFDDGDVDDFFSEDMSIEAMVLDRSPDSLSSQPEVKQQQEQQQEQQQQDDSGWPIFFRGVGKFFNDVMDATFGPAMPGSRIYEIDRPTIDLQCELRRKGYEFTPQQCAQLLSRYKTQEGAIEAVVQHYSRQQ